MLEKMVHIEKITFLDEAIDQNPALLSMTDFPL